MNGLVLGLAYLRHRLLSTLLTLLTLASGVALIVALLLINNQLQDEFSKNLQGIDMVAGAKGSPMQLILSSVFHLDIPTGNIPLKEAQALAKNPMIAESYPIALGDNYNGYRIVGTTPAYIAHYRGELAEGTMFSSAMQAVAGSEAAAAYGLKPGVQIVGAHGLVNSDDLHSDFPYTVVGILRPTGTVLDRLIITPVESVWHVHEHPDPDDAEEIAYKKIHPEQEITALLIRYKTPLAAASLPRAVNSSSSMQAASPAFEVARLTRFMGVGADTLQAFGYFLMVLAALGIFVAIYNAMDERRYDLALMRSMGASPARLWLLITSESMVLAGLGALMGMVLGHGAMALAAGWLASEKHIHIAVQSVSAQELWVLAASLLLGMIAAMIPAIRVYRIDIYKTLVK